MLLLLLAASLAAPPVASEVSTAVVADGKPGAVDDWQAMTITKVARSSRSSSSSSPIYLWVSAGDLDGDGAVDEAVVKLHCDGGTITGSSYQIVSPRDLATGQASGKRMHKPFVVTHEWDAASTELSALKPTYDIKTMKGSRTAGSGMGTSNNDVWTALDLSHTDGVCAAAASSTKVVKTRSNIQNN